MDWSIYCLSGSKWWRSSSLLILTLWKPWVGGDPFKHPFEKPTGALLALSTCVHLVKLHIKHPDFSERVASLSSLSECSHRNQTSWLFGCLLRSIHLVPKVSEGGAGVDLFKPSNPHFLVPSALPLCPSSLEGLALCGARLAGPAHMNGMASIQHVNPTTSNK